MCFVNVKEYEEDYSVPARVTRVRTVRRPSPSPPRAVRYSRRSFVEERRPSYATLPPPSTVVIPPPQPAPVFVEPPPQTVLVPSPHASTTIRSERRISRPPSRAPSRTRSAYVEVDNESDTSSSSSSSDVRSRTTSHTRKTSRSKATAPVSEYSVHEKEYRRERGYSRPRDEYETYRYVEAPPARSRNARIDRSRSSYDDPSASRESPRRETNITIEDGGERRRMNYRR